MSRIRMQELRRTIAVLAGIVLCVVLCSACAVNSSAEATKSGKSTPAAIIVPAFELASPERLESRQYLGIGSADVFTISDIAAPVLIIEIFSMYCPHCQNEAPKVNELYETIQKSAELKSKIKVIGIGAANSQLEVDLFRDKYSIPFPLFPDQDMTIARELGVRSTPTFIGMKNDAGREAFYFKSGSFGTVSEFLNEVVRLSGLSKEGS